MPVNIRGNDYWTVSERVNKFREEHPEWSIQTEIVHIDDNSVLVKALVLNENERIVASDYAEEIRGSSNINKTSAVENCCTSAIGRALAAFGLSGTEYASANEVTDALIQQSVDEAMERILASVAAARDNFESIAAVKSQIRLFEMSQSPPELALAAEAMLELDQATKKLLWIAPSKGGIWTTAERAMFKSNDWNDAIKEMRED